MLRESCLDLSARLNLYPGYSIIDEEIVDSEEELVLDALKIYSCHARHPETQSHDPHQQFRKALR